MGQDPCRDPVSLFHSSPRPTYRVMTEEESLPPDQGRPDQGLTDQSGPSSTWTPQSTEVPSPKNPKVSPLGRLLPPVLGGLSAIPIAIAILWYGFGKDIANAGPTVARYIPWLVPEHLRGSARWRYNPKTDSKQKQFDAPANLDAGEFGRIGGDK